MLICARWNMGMFKLCAFHSVLILGIMLVQEKRAHAAMKCPWERELTREWKKPCPPETGVKTAGWFYTKVVNNIFWPASHRDQCSYAFEGALLKGIKTYPRTEYEKDIKGKTILKIPGLNVAELKGELAGQKFEKVILDSYTVEYERLPPAVDRNLKKNCDEHLFTKKGNKNNFLAPLRLITEAEFVRSFNYTLSFTTKFQGNVDLIIKKIQESNPNFHVEGVTSTSGNISLKIEPSENRYLIAYKPEVVNSRKSVLGR